MVYQVPGVGEIELNTIVLDLNGTLSVNGVIPDGVKERIDKLKQLGFSIVLFSGDQRGTAGAICKDLQIQLIRCGTSIEKEIAMDQLPGDKTVAIGNARIDIGTFKKAKIRIATLQNEGIHREILDYVDVIVPSINAAFDLLIDTDSFCATMRK